MISFLIRRKNGRSPLLRLTALVQVMLLSIAVVLFSPQTAFADETQDVPDVVVDAKKSVVRVLMTYKDGTYLGHGSAFAVGKYGEESDTFITNGHCVTVSGLLDPADVKIYIPLDNQTTVDIAYQMNGDDLAKDEDGNLIAVSATLNLQAYVECEVLACSYPYPDVAVIRVKSSGRSGAVETGCTALALKKADDNYVGKAVYALGYPGVSDTFTAETDGYIGTDNYFHSISSITGAVDSVSLTTGNISRILSYEAFDDTRAIEHYAHINSGNSGGPLLAADGSVIGINTYGMSTDSAYSYSIDIDYAMQMLSDIGIEYTETADDTVEILGIRISYKAAALGVIIVLLGILAAVIFVYMKKKSGSRKTPESSAMPEVPAAPLLTPGMQPAGAPELAVISDLRLQGVSGAFAGRRFALEDNLTIGRDRARCRLVYPGDTKGISGLHCVLGIREGGLTVTDLGSTYGTTVNGRKIAANIPVGISVGDKICLGSERECFQITKKGGVV